MAPKEVHESTLPQTLPSEVPLTNPTRKNKQHSRLAGLTIKVRIEDHLQGQVYIFVLGALSQHISCKKAM